MYLFARVKNNSQQISETSVSPITLSRKVVDFRKEKAVIQDMAYLTGRFIFSDYIDSNHTLLNVKIVIAWFG